MKHTIDVQWEQIEAIIAKELDWDLKKTLDDMETVKKTKKGFVYSHDMDEDLEELTIRAGALAVVLSYYGGCNESTSC